MTDRGHQLVDTIGRIQRQDALRSRAELGTHVRGHEHGIEVRFCAEQGRELVGLNQGGIHAHIR
ncbi:MAG: hypothetical protein ABR573_01045 [Candidatus Dormibacteria bacterium]